MHFGAKIAENSPVLQPFLIFVDLNVTRTNLYYTFENVCVKIWNAEYGEWVLSECKTVVLAE